MLLKKTEIIIWWINNFFIYGYGNTSNNGEVKFFYTSPNNTSGWMVSQSMEILTSSSTMGGTWSWFNGSIYDNGYNNRNP